MAILERPRNQQIMINSIVWTGLLAMVLLIGLLVYQSSTVKDSVAAVSRNVGLGPLNLFEITRVPLQGGGYEGSISLKNGLVWYFLVWVLVACFMGWFRINKIKKL